MIAIIGGGASGILAAAHFRRAGQAVTILEPGTLTGIAYSTTEPTHLLNVRAAKMSAWPEAPADFVSWSGLAPEAFAPRMLYGAYLKSLIDPDSVTVGRASRVEANRVHLSDGRVIDAQKIVLAMGHQPTQARGHSAWLPLPADIAKHQLVTILGTGLTCVDVLLSLESRGFRGRVQAISRHGWLPLAHETSVIAPRPFEQNPTTLRAMVSAIRAHARTGGSWQSGIDGVRPHTQRLWQLLTAQEKARFIRHASTAWSIHRHRSAPEPLAHVQRWLAEGRLRILRGRAANEGFVINALGPSTSQHPIAEQLIAEGHAQSGPLGLGLHTDNDGALIDATGKASHTLFTLGPLRTGDLWETMAVPEIAVQAQRLSR